MAMTNFKVKDMKRHKTWQTWTFRGTTFCKDDGTSNYTWKGPED